MLSDTGKVVIIRRMDHSVSRLGSGAKAMEVIHITNEYLAFRAG
jgi:hypothetical protein